METAIYRLDIDQGVTLKGYFAIDLPDGSGGYTAADLPSLGYSTARLHVRDRYGGSLMIPLTTENGGIVLGRVTDADGVQWSGYIYVSAQATAALVPWGDGVWDMEISNGFDVVKPFRGPATLHPEVTTDD